MPTQLEIEIISPLESAFTTFHEANPHVYHLIVRFAREKKRAGFKHYGIAGVFERVRWEMPITTEGDAFKLNNNYRAFYARLVMAECPDLAGFFHTRRQSQ